MSFGIASIVSLFLLEAILASVGLAIGLGIGWLVFGRRQLKDRDNQLQADRTLMVAGQIQDLAHQMVHDVDAHSAQVQKISSDLQEMSDDDSVTMQDTVLTTITNIVSANSQLHMQLAEAEERLKQQAEQIACHESAAKTDTLTQLSNRRGFDEELKRRLAEWERHQTPFSLLLTDVDSFKSFNDQHGHLAGDEILKSVGQCLIEMTREMDLPCRYGGEEFAVIMPATKCKDAFRAAERVRKSIAAMRVDFEGQELHVTTSVGLAEIKPDDDQSMLIRRADAALYAAKNAGRNKGYWNDGEQCLPIVGNDKAKGPAKEKRFKSPKHLRGLADDKASQEELQRRASESEQYGVPLSLMLMELSDYDGLLAQYGEDGTDAALDTVVEVATGALREMDLIYRTSSSQLAILFPGSSRSEADQVRRRIRNSLCQSKVSNGVDSFCVATQDGLVEFNKGMTAEEFFAAAVTDLQQSAKKKNDRKLAPAEA